MQQRNLTPDIIVEKYPEKQCSGSVTFWYGSGFEDLDRIRIRIRIQFGT
jgi:hypothetical protein